MNYPPEATFYVRLSLMMPKQGERDRVLEMHRDLVEWLRGQPGFVRGYVIESGDPAGRVGHLNLYQSEEAADHAAQTQHVLSVRADVMLLIDKDSHAEHRYVAYDPQLGKTLAS